MTLRDVAKSLGISHVTVSRALHDHPRISLIRRRQIQEAAARMGYTPNPLATGLGQQRHSTKIHPISAGIAWINPWAEPGRLRGFHEFDLYWQGAFRTAEQAGYRLEEFVCNQHLTSARLEEILLARSIRGILIPPCAGPMPQGWEKIHWEKFCVVRFGYTLPNPAAHVVSSNQLVNGLLAFDNMRHLGYERIGFVSNRAITTRFHAGFLMRQHEVKSSHRVPMLLLPEEVNDPSKVSHFSAWLAQYQPDAILTDIAVMRKMLEYAGYRIPEDIGLATLTVLDGEADAGIYQNSEEIGKTAMELLISLINHNHVGIPNFCREVLIAGQWIDGLTLPRRAAVNLKQPVTALQKRTLQPVKL